MSRALGAAKEADQQAFLPDFDARPVVGYGLVTINGSYWRKPAYHNTPAWVVAYTDNRPTSCPAMPLRTSPPPKPSPPLPKHHYTVFVLPDAETWAVTFDERSLAPCFGTVRPSSAELAHTQQLVVWHEVSRHGRRVTLGYTIPSCAEAAGAESSANTKANSLTIQLAEALPFGHPPNCTDRLPKTMDWDLITPTTTLTPPHAGPADF
jgi:hypothetical protein